MECTYTTPLSSTRWSHFPKHVDTRTQYMGLSYVLKASSTGFPQAQEAASQGLKDKLRDEARRERMSQQRERELLTKFRQDKVNLLHLSYIGTWTFETIHSLASHGALVLDDVQRSSCLYITWYACFCGLLLCRNNRVHFRAF